MESQNLMTGITSISAHLTPPQIKTLVMDTLLPKLRNSFPGYQFQVDKLKVRDIAKWADMDEEPIDKPFLYLTHCIAAARNGKQKSSTGTVFKKPARPIAFALVIDHKQYNDCIDFVVEQEVSHWIINRSSSSKPNTTVLSV
jgi:hypothetical protein